MAHKRNPKKRWKHPLVYIPVTSGLVLSTLADNTVLKGTVQAAFTRRFHILYMKCFWAIRGNTIGEGPILVGYNHGDYTIAEILENLDVAILNTANKIERERASRLVRKVGFFVAFSVSEELRGNKGGEAVYTKLNWTIEEGETLDLFAINRSGGALTGGQIVEIEGTMVGYWR